MFLRKEIKEARRGFTLVEMLIVIGIIAILTVALATSFAKMTKTAEKARAQELVSEVATALTQIYEKDGAWPKTIRDAVAADGGEADLDADNDVALLLAKRGYLALGVNKAKDKLIGRDRFGVLTPWMAKAIERRTDAGLNTKVNGTTVEENILKFAVDLNGDGVVKPKSYSEGIRATAVVWCIDKTGKDVVKSWSAGQARNVSKTKK